MAWNLRSRPCLGRAAGAVALDDKQLGLGRVALLAVGELAGQRRTLQRAFAPGQFPRGAGSLPGPGREQGFVQDFAGHSRVFLQKCGEFGCDQLFDKPAHLGVAQLGLGLSLELGLLELDADHGRQTLADVLAREVLIAFLENAEAARIIVEHLCQARLKAGLVHAALGGVYVVCKGQDNFIVRIVVLQRDLRLARLLFHTDVNGFVQHFGAFFGVDILDKAHDPALVVQADLLLAAFAPVGQNDLHAAVKERLFAQAGQQRVKVELNLVENLAVGQEGNAGPDLVSLAGHSQGRDAIAALIALEVHVSILEHLDFEVFGQGVDDGRAHTVQAARNFVAAASELAASVQDGEHDFNCGQAGLLLDVDGNAAPVVLDDDYVPLLDGDPDIVAVTRQRLVNGVVHNLIDEMVQPARRRGPDVHARALSDGFQPF